MFWLLESLLPGMQPRSREARVVGDYFVGDERSFARLASRLTAGAQHALGGRNTPLSPDDLMRLDTYTIPASDSEPPLCPITLEPLQPGASALRLPCGHIFSPEAVRQWLQSNPTCPVCRKRVTRQGLQDDPGNTVYLNARAIPRHPSPGSSAPSDEPAEHEHAHPRIRLTDAQQALLGPPRVSQLDDPLLRP